MIELETRTLAGQQVLHAWPKGGAEKALPTIVFYHGFTSSNLVYSYFAVALAQGGNLCRAKACSSRTQTLQHRIRRGGCWMS